MGKKGIGVIIIVLVIVLTLVAFYSLNESQTVATGNVTKLNVSSDFEL